MSFLSRHIDNLLQMDRQTIAALVLICALAAFFIKDCLRHPPFVTFIYPILLALSILIPIFLLERL